MYHNQGKEQKVFLWTGRKIISKDDFSLKLNSKLSNLKLILKLNEEIVKRKLKFMSFGKVRLTIPGKGIVSKKTNRGPTNRLVEIALYECRQQTMVSQGTDLSIINMSYL